MPTSNKKNRIIVVLVTVLVVIAGIALFKFALTNPTINRQFNKRIESIKAAGENVDMLFVGGSRTYRSFDPEIFDETLGLSNSTNMGTPSQRPVLSYYLLEDMLEDFTPEYVVLGVSYNGLLYEQTPHTVMFALDRLSIKNRIRCVVDHFGINKGLLTMTGKSEYKDNFTIGSIKSNVYNKIKYGGTETVTEGPGARTNGYLGAPEKMPIGGINYRYGKTPSANGLQYMDPKAYEYFDKSVQLCKSKGIKVILVSGTCSLMNIFKVLDYQQYPDYYNEYAEKNGIEYYNLNYLKNREQDYTDDMFVDYLHLNYYGSQKVSKTFAQIIKDREEGKDVSHYFYKNLGELRQDVHRIPGCAVKVTVYGNTVNVYGDCVCNPWVTPEYRVLVSNKTASGEYGKFKQVAGWTTDRNFAIAASKLPAAGTIKLEVRTGAGDTNVAYSVKKY